MDKILQQIVWKLTSDDVENFLFLADIIKGKENERGGGGTGKTSDSTDETKEATVCC